MGQQALRCSLELLAKGQRSTSRISSNEAATYCQEPCSPKAGHVAVIKTATLLQQNALNDQSAAKQRVRSICVRVCTTQSCLVVQIPACVQSHSAHALIWLGAFCNTRRLP